MRAKKQNTEENSNKMYVFDLENIINFVFDKDGSSDTRNIEITENYEYNEDISALKLKSKVVKETKGSSVKNPASDNIRYDLIKFFIASLEELPSNIPDSSISFGDKVIINTMINEELIKIV